ncbi:MAG TPA: carbohydrate porin [Aliidongia sp.]|uniref:carbohydrate porin n=1 Tax=Aliidongia sp. TaxID=1914230 RepID=UPI002DDCB807|nr:carbohydrate porin [Aliidongia sp.]HEV2678367.1 carbohydrate porin [Aliidongia sp.]
MTDRIPAPSMRHRGTVAAGLALLGVAGPALADDAGLQAAKPTGLWERDTLTGDWGGVRSDLEDAGIKLGAIEISEGLADLRGGARTGAAYEGRTELDLDLDLEKLAGWTGAAIHVNAWQSHGRGVSGNYTGNLLTASDVEADRGTRLFDLYLDQTAFDGLVSLRIGQQGADDEFIASKTAGLFFNSTFGYPGLPSLDQPSGGPAFPLATPAVRLKLAPTDQVTLLVAAFDGDPAGPGTGDPQARDASGTAFRTGDGVLGFFEAQYAVNQGKDAAGLPGTYKLGAWVHSGRFADQHFDRTGLSLADPRSSGLARQHDGDWSVYGIADQMLWRRPDTDDQGLSLFVRLMGAPADRNLMDLYADGGLNFKGPFAGRDGDLIGLACAYGRISADASRLDADLQHGLPGRPVRDNESLIEATYQAQVAPWWQLQPDLQYIVHPGGHAPLPTDPTQRRTIGNATVVGVRTVVTF